MAAIKAHFDGKVFIPDEPVDLPENCEVTVHAALPDAPIEIPSGMTALDAMDWLAENVAIADDDLPADYAHQHDHYLYGTPKKPVNKP